MAQVARVTTWASGQKLLASDLNTEFNTIFNAWNNADTGSTKWQVVSASNSSNVPLIADNSVGTNDIFNAKANGTTVFQIANNGLLTVKNSSNSTTAYQFQNAAGTSVMTVDTTNARVGIGVTPAAILHLSRAGGDEIRLDGVTSANVFSVQVVGGASPRFLVQDNTNSKEVLNVDSNDNLLLVPGGALATTATAGYLHINSVAGTPTGAPGAATTARPAIIYDTAGNKIWVYSGSWRSVALA